MIVYLRHFIQKEESLVLIHILNSYKLWAFKIKNKYYLKVKRPD